MNNVRAPIPWAPISSTTAMIGAHATAAPTAIRKALRFHFILEVMLPDGTVRRLLPTQLLDQQQQQQPLPPPIPNFAHPGLSSHHYVPTMTGSSNVHHQNVLTTLERALQQLHESQLPNHLWKVKKVEFVGASNSRKQSRISRI